MSYGTNTFSFGLDNTDAPLKLLSIELTSLISVLFKFKSYQNNEVILFRKHCINDKDTPSHNCGKKNNQFIIVKNDNNKIKFLICSKITL